MSEPSDSHEVQITCNPAGLHGGSPLARALHVRGLLVRSVAIASALGGCVIPPSLSVDNQDAGVNSPPAILALRSDNSGELPEPGPVIFDVNRGTLTADVIDTDIQDTLFVHVFFEYKIGHETSPRAKCTAPPNGKAERTATCDIHSVCLDEDVGDELTEHNIQIMVFDREPLDSGTPLFQTMPPPGLATSRFYFLKCNGEPQ
jgi:hypothetical protein